MSNKIFSFTEYIKEFPSNKRVREFWKLFKTRGSLDNRHLCFNICQDCANYLFNDKEKLKFETDKDSELLCVLIGFKLCEDCVERNVFEVNSYIYKYALRRRNQPNSVTIENKSESNEKEQPTISACKNKPKKSKKADDE